MHYVCSALKKTGLLRASLTVPPVYNTTERSTLKNGVVFFSLLSTSATHLGLFSFIIPVNDSSSLGIEQRTPKRYIPNPQTSPPWAAEHTRGNVSNVLFLAAFNRAPGETYMVVERNRLSRVRCRATKHGTPNGISDIVESAMPIRLASESPNNPSYICLTLRAVESQAPISHRRPFKPVTRFEGNHFTLEN